MYALFKNFIKWVGSNYTLSSLYHGWRLGNEARKPGDPVIVYQMGKVASTAIVHALKVSRPDIPVYHVHFLSESGIAHARRRLGEQNKSFNANFWCLYESDFLRRHVLNRTDNGKLRIVTLFREPVARTISSFFYNLDQYVPGLNRYRPEDSRIIEQLESRFLDEFIEHGYTIEWFDNELKRVFGVDVFQRDFDTEKGYAIIRQDKIEVLVLKLEKLKDCAQNAFKEFMDLPDFDLSRANTSEEQPYYPFYKVFLKQVSLPESYLDRMYESRYMKHFYTAEEIAAYRKQWQHS